MALPKVLGIETEYGILVRGGESNPIAASSVLINAYVQELARVGAATGATRVGWDFEDEHPGNDARASTWAGRRRPRWRPTSSTRSSPTVPATTWTTPIRSCPRPSAPTPAPWSSTTGPRS